MKQTILGCTLWREGFILSITGLILLLFFSSCEKVIDVKINDADKKYVIEGNVFNIPSQPQEVKISQTKNFSDENNFMGISGALVSIRENNGRNFQRCLPDCSFYRDTG